ncbi:MAG: ABC transporter ATP-binding protein [Ruminococcus sp.]|nr:MULTISPECIES: ABC transporter ATP-binding protein [Ruminococcus]MDD5889418.1 ABC transporter ATP-binding protein [Ruminococcus sp.]MDD6709598.1 ABC transporter ATP-binding protein [Ruminococcus sp.]MDY3662179.1 ABC transporter ATP-binding protein [Ruminococcus bovis]
MSKVSNSMNIIELKNVGKSFDDVVVVEDFNLEVKKGEFVTFLGPSGCGKTTTLRMIAGFEIPTEGQITLKGEDISKLPPYERPINTVFQRYALFPHLNIYDNIAFGLKLKTNEVTYKKDNGKIITRKEKLSKKEIDKKVKRALEIVDLEGFEKRSVDTLSGGQQQRIAIARAIVNEPQILLLDEPLGALDLKMRKEMQIELKAMHERLGITFIYVTHDQEEALTMSDKIVVMSDGVIQQIGTPEEIYNEPKNAFVADFIGESNIFNGKVTDKLQVQFCDHTFTCVDDFHIGTKVEVVVRPEDIVMKPKGEGMMDVVVDSVVFKGVHYEITVLSGDNEIVIHSIYNAVVGDTISIDIDPDSIHLIENNLTTNDFDGIITKHNTVEFADGEFECDLTQLYPNSKYVDDVLVDEKGNEIDVVGKEVSVSIPVFGSIEMSDDADKGGTTGNIISLIYKGDHYQYIVRTENEYDFIFDDEDLWNENDFVSLIIPKENISLKLK